MSVSSLQDESHFRNKAYSGFNISNIIVPVARY